MAETAFQKQYRDELIAGFEKKISLARHTCTTETVVSGNEAIFLVSDSGGATATTRGLNGDIPARADNNNQFTCTLAEWHDLVEKTKFNIFASQGNQRELMQRTTMSVINRKIDKDIHTALDAATVTLGAAAVITMPLITQAITKLGNAFATEDDTIYALITPAFYGYLMAMNQFTSADYISDKKFEGVPISRAFNWYGVNWIVDAGLTGAGSASATCYMYSKAAIGHAFDTETLDTAVGYDEKQAKSWARVSGIFGTKLLQNSGVVKILHNDSGLS